MEKRSRTQCSSGMRYRNVEFLVSILYYSPAVVQPRKPFVQEISRKKDCTVFQCLPYIFPYNLPHTSCMCCTYCTAVYSTCTWYQLRSTACMFGCTKPDLNTSTMSFLRMFIFSDWLSFYLIILRYSSNQTLSRLTSIVSVPNTCNWVLGWNQNYGSRFGSCTRKVLLACSRIGVP